MQSFKEGDKVKCISLEGFKREGDYYFERKYIKIGDVFTVLAISDYSGELGINFELHSYIFPASSFKLVTNEIINSYEIY